MGIKKFRPRTPGTRHMTQLDNADLTRGVEPERKLLVTLKKSGGRNHRGVITSPHRGGGHKQKIRLVDFKRADKDGITAKVDSIQYDPGRTANVALLHYADGEKRYILAPNGLTVGRHVMNGPTAEPEVGNCLPLENIPLGLHVHNVELEPGRGGRLARSAGMQVTLMAKEGPHAIILLPSGEMRRVDRRCRATIGVVGNLDHGMVSIGKAGRNRWKGWRPYSRPSAMNPVDHPMGGGEGRHAGGHEFQSRTGVYARGQKTRNPRKLTSKMIISRRKKRK